MRFTGKRGRSQRLRSATNFCPALRRGSLHYWTIDQVAQAAQATAAIGPNVEANWPIICRAFDTWALHVPGINSRAAMAGLVGTIAKESGRFAPVREAYWLSEEARWAYYSDTTQHAPYGGGPNYHGRGYIQTTHLSGYHLVEQDLREILGIWQPIATDPDLLLDPVWAAHAAAVFWRRKGLPQLCEAHDWPEVRRRVWGAYGDADGVAKLRHAAAVLL